MKKIALTGVLFSLVFATAYAAEGSQPANANAGLNTDKAKLSYTIGYDMGHNFKEQGIQVDPTVVEQGIQDGLTGSKAKMTSQEMSDTLVKFQKSLLAQRAQKYKGMAAQNAKEGATFLAANKTKKDVKTLPSGIQYKVVTPGTGATPGLNDVVTVDYTGTFINGKEFDSSYKRGKPTTFPLSEVIQGWQDALTHMKTGATWVIYVPAKLAYGDKMIGEIGPNKTLIFKIHLIKIDKKSPQPQSAANAPAAQPANNTQ